MICPSLPQWLPGKDETTAYQYFASEMAATIRAERCEHVWAEVINLRGDSFTRTEKALRDGGYGAMADELHHVSVDKSEWEKYARNTYIALSGITEFHQHQSKLRFMQYVTKDTEAWWKENGAVIL